MSQNHANGEEHMSLPERVANSRQIPEDTGDLPPGYSGSESLAGSKINTASLSGNSTLGESNESENQPEVEIDEVEHLRRMRDTWRSMLKVVPQDGAASYLVPTAYLEKMLDLENASSISQLVSTIGKLSSASLVNEFGALPEEATEPEPFTPICPELFHQLVSVFGLQGDPVIRTIVVQDDGTVALERNPPFFVVHALSESSVLPKYYGTYDRSNQQYRCTFSLSQSKTFRNLVDAIKTCMFRAKNIEIRVWFISSLKVKDLPPAIPVPMFINDIDDKKLISASIMDQTLRSQGITASRFHLVAESVHRTTRKYPVDQAVASFDLSLLDSSRILHSGGNLGLSNLGNTCYMNLALQCLVHLPEINSYFFFDLYERELNKSNPLGNKGEVAIAFSNLLHKLFDVHTSNSSYVTPRDFKYTIGRYSSMFHGYQQQDSQEFLSWLLDALHEDLNRIYDKPYLEKPELKDEDVGNPAAILELANTCWSQHKQRNDSIIVDLFTGLYQSTLICPDCSKQSITFDPFNDLTLPLPVNKRWYHLFTVVDLSPDLERAAILELEVELTKSSNFEDLVRYLSDFLRVPASHLFLFEVFRNYFYKNFQDNSNANNFLPVSELMSQDDIIVAYIIPHDPLKDMIIPLVNVVRNEDRSYAISEPFGIPLFVVLESASDATSFGTIRRKVEQAVKILNMGARFNALKGESSKPYYTAGNFPLLKGTSLPEDAVMSDVSQSPGHADSDGYDSDVSLANPNISSSLGFEIKIYEEKRQTKTLRKSRQDTEPHTSNCLNIPEGRPQFGSLPLLADKLDELKRSFYHNPEYAQKAGLKPDDADEEESSSSESNKLCKQTVTESSVLPDKENHGFVLVDKISEGLTESPKDINGDIPPTSSDDEDIESDPNWDKVNPLFASVDNLNPPLTFSDTSGPSSTTPLSTHELMNASAVKKHAKLVSEKSMLVIEWDALLYGQFFSDQSHQAWMHPRTIPNPKLEESKRLLNKQQSSTISLYDCFRNFSTPEVLGEQDLWYCPRCKEHKRATKTIQLWSTGDLLTVHLKRFQSARHFSDKIDMVVDFPLEGLDMSEFVNSTSQSEGALIYDLVAVDEHYGGLGGGHYTAAAKNFRDGMWYKFNDGRVTAMNDPRDCVSGAAYLLFYKKRTASVFAGGNGVEALLKDGQSQFETRIMRLKSHMDQVRQEIEAFNYQELQVEEQILQDNAEEPATKNSPEQSDEVEDLYSDSDLNEHPETSGLHYSGSNKKSRSPMTEQSMKLEFENQRKQRLISKGSDLPRSVNINMGYYSSVSNLASPTGSTDEEVI